MTLTHFLSICFVALHCFKSRNLKNIPCCTYRYPTQDSSTAAYSCVSVHVSRLPEASHLDLTVLEHTHRSEATDPVSIARNLYIHKEMYALKILLILADTTRRRHVLCKSVPYWRHNSMTCPFTLRFRLTAPSQPRSG